MEELCGEAAEWQNFRQSSSREKRGHSKEMQPQHSGRCKRGPIVTAI